MGAEVFKNGLGFISSRQQTPEIVIHGDVVIQCCWCQRLTGKSRERALGAGREAGPLQLASPLLGVL